MNNKINVNNYSNMTTDQTCKLSIFFIKSTEMKIQSNHDESAESELCLDLVILI